MNIMYYNIFDNQLYLFSLHSNKIYKKKKKISSKKCKYRNEIL